MDLGGVCIPLWSVPKCENELQYEKGQIPNLQHVVDDRGDIVSKRPALEFVRRARGPDDIQDHRARQPI